MINKVTSSSIFKRIEHQRKVARHFIEKFLNDWSFDFASMLAYNFLIALVPIVITLFGLMGLILKNYPQMQQDLKNKIIQSFPADNITQTGIRQVFDLAFDQLSKEAGLVLFMGIIFSIIGSSRLFIAIDKCMTIIYRLPERSFLRQNLMSLGILFLLIITITLMFAASSLPSILINIIPGSENRFSLFISSIFLSLLMGFILFEIVYYLIPNKKMTLKKTWCGSLIASIILEIFIILFPWYVRQFMSNYVGQIGFAIILILFLYYFSIILIFGGQINAYFFEEYPPLNDTLGTYISQLHDEHFHDNTKEILHNNN